MESKLTTFVYHPTTQRVARAAGAAAVMLATVLVMMFAAVAGGRIKAKDLVGGK